MALRETETHFRFSGGVETKSDPKTTPATRLLALENGVFSRATSIKKRNGYESIATISGAIRNATRGDEHIVFTANRSYSLQSNGGAPIDAGAVYSAVPTDRPLVATGTDQTMPDHATLSGVTVAAWEDSRGGVWWEVLDATSGHVHRAPGQADASGVAPRCVAVGSNLHVYYALPAAHRIMAIVVNPADPTAAVSPVLVIDDLDSTQPMYDACPTGRFGSPALVAWFEQATTSIKIGYITGAGELGSPLTGLPTVFTSPVGRGATSPIGVSYATVDGSTGDFYAYVYVDGSANAVVRVRSAASETSAIIYASTDVLRAGVTIGTNGVPWTAWEESAAAASNRRIVVGAMIGATAAHVATLRSVGLATKPFLIGTDAFVCVVHDTTSFNVYLTARISNADTDGFVYVGRHVPGSAAGAPTRQHLSSAYAVGSVAAFALPFKQRLISENNDKFSETSIRRFTLDFDNAQSHQSAEFGRGLYLAGGCPSHYDGRAWTELGFHVGPELIVTVNAGGGSMTSSTTYEYIAWYESTDNQGEVHRGPTSIGTLVTMGGGDTQVTLTLPTLRVTQKTNVRIMVARSLAAKTGDTARHFRVTSLDPSTAGAANGYVANDTTVDTVTFIDRMSDATLATFDELYTDGGILSNDPAPLGKAMARGKSRLFSLDPSDGTLVRYSQPLDDGYGVEWPPDLMVRTDPIGGDATAITTRDNRVIVWCEGAIYTFAGDGPAPNGDTSVGGFAAVELVPGDVGCTEPASIVLTPHGHMFKSSKGIYLLGNDFSLQYIGAPVEAYNGQTIRRATVLPDRTAVVFLTDSGLTLLYDYLFGQWSTFTNHEGLDAAVVAGQYHYIRTDGRVFRETVGSYSDAGARIRLVLETAWIHMLDQLQGHQKFFEMYLIGTWTSAHQLGVQYQTDYTPQWTDAVWLDATGSSSSAGWITGTGANAIGVESIAGSTYGDGQYGDGDYGGTMPGEYEWRLDLYEPGESIQFRFQDFEAAGLAGASFELTELVLTGGAIGNVRRPMTAGRSA
jgi:hypothetical protein